MKIYSLGFGQNDGREWELNDPRSVEYGEMAFDRFCSGTRYHKLTGLFVPVIRVGEPLDLSFTTYAAPVLSKKAADAFAHCCPGVVDLHEAVVDGSEEPHFVANFFHLVDCLDWRRSNAVVYPGSEGSPKKRLMSVLPLVIRKTALTNDLSAFRVCDWSGVLLVTEVVKEYLTASVLTGMSFSLIQQK